MKPRASSTQKSVAIIFDEKSRRDYVTGFQKRKSQRRHKVKLQQAKLAKEARKKMREEKKGAIKEKMDVYGLNIDAQPPRYPTGSTSTRSTQSSSTRVCEDHPNHIVIINTNPSFGDSLSTVPELDTS